jgi:hypothetical protein
LEVDCSEACSEVDSEPARTGEVGREEGTGAAVEIQAAVGEP